MHSEPPAAWLGGKDKHAYYPGVDRLLCIMFWGRKMEIVLKEFTLPIDKVVQEKM